MASENVIFYDGLFYERTEDVSVLSDFYCGVFDMDSFIHHHLQSAVSREDLETYVIRDGLEIVAVLSICDNILKTERTNGETVVYETKEVEYLAVEKSHQHKGIGRKIIQMMKECLMADKKILSVSAYIDIDSKYSAEPFYQKCGFFRISDPPHTLADHVRMVRFL